MSIISTIEADWEAVKAWWNKEQPKVVDGFTSADKIVNILKTVTTGVSGQLLLATVDAFKPGASAEVTKILTEVFKDWGWVEAEASKTPEQIALDGIAKAAGMSGNAKILALSNIAALIGKVLSETSTLQQAIATMPIVHDSTVLGAAPVSAPTPAPEVPNPLPQQP